MAQASDGVHQPLRASIATFVGTNISMAYWLSGAIFGGLTPILSTILAEKAGGAWWPLALLFSTIAAISPVSVLALRGPRERQMMRTA